MTTSSLLLRNSLKNRLHLLWCFERSCDIIDCQIESSISVRNKRLKLTQLFYLRLAGEVSLKIYLFYISMYVCICLHEHMCTYVYSCTCGGEDLWPFRAGAPGVCRMPDFLDECWILSPVSEIVRQGLSAGPLLAHANIHAIGPVNL